MFIFFGVVELSWSMVTPALSYRSLIPTDLLIY